MRPGNCRNVFSHSRLALPYFSTSFHPSAPFSTRLRRDQQNFLQQVIPVPIHPRVLQLRQILLGIVDFPLWLLSTLLHIGIHDASALPPELPGLRAAPAWTVSSIIRPNETHMLRPSALTTPAVTEN
jgi:hypothetical protein